MTQEGVAGNISMDGAADAMTAGYNLTSAGDVLQCVGCRSTSTDTDLADPTQSRPTPFLRARLRGNAHMLCDHCDSLIRSGMDGASTPSVVAMLAQPSERAKFLRLLACSLSLKFREAATKVHKVTLAKTLGLVESFDDFYKTLQGRFGSLNLAEDQGFTPKFLNVLGLRDYVKSHGNPITNNEVLSQAQVDDKIQIVVLTSKAVGARGRHPLQPVVEQAAAHGCDAEALQLAASLSTDCLDACKLMGHLVAEYSSRALWQQDVVRNLTSSGSPGTLAPPAPARAATPPTGSSSDPITPQASRTRPVTSPGSSSMPAGGRPASGAANSSHARPGSERNRDEDDDDDDADDGNASSAAPVAETPPSGSAAGSAAGSNGMRAPGSAPSPKRLRTATGCYASPAAPRTARSAGIRGSPGSTDGKETWRLRRRAVDLCRTFVPADWRRGLRNKEKAAGNLALAVEKEMEKCRSSRREDRLDALTEIHTVAQASCELIKAGKVRANALENDQERLCGPISIVADFLEEFSAKLTDDGEPVVISVSLRKLQASDLRGNSWGSVDELAHP